MIQWILAGLALFLLAVWIPTYLDVRREERDKQE